MTVFSESFRQIFDAAFDEVEKLHLAESNRNIINHLLTSLDTATQQTTKTLEKRVKDAEEKFHDAKVECKKLEEDSAKSHAALVDLQRKVNVANTVKYDPMCVMEYPKMDKMEKWILNNKIFLEKKREQLIDLSNLRDIKF